MTRPAGTGYCWCPDCHVTTLHDIDLLTEHTTGHEFPVATCRICGHLTALDNED